MYSSVLPKPKRAGGQEKRKGCSRGDEPKKVPRLGEEKGVGADGVTRKGQAAGRRGLGTARRMAAHSGLPWSLGALLLGQA